MIEYKEGKSKGKTRIFKTKHNFIFEIQECIVLIQKKNYFL